jgi:hypothetical protein
MLDRFGAVLCRPNQRTSNGKNEYGGLSTAQRTIKLSVASVEMTGVERRTGNNKDRSRSFASLEDDNVGGLNFDTVDCLRLASKRAMSHEL